MFFTVKSIAQELGLSSRAVQKRMPGFKGGRKRVKGKGFEYPLDGLPADYQARLRELGYSKTTPIYKEKKDGESNPGTLVGGVGDRLGDSGGVGSDGDGGEDSERGTGGALQDQGDPIQFVTQVPRGWEVSPGAGGVILSSGDSSSEPRTRNRKPKQLSLLPGHDFSYRTNRAYPGLSEALPMDMAQARLDVLAARTAFCEFYGLKKTDCTALFAMQYEDLDLDPGLKDLIPDVSKSTIFGWEKQYQKGGIEGLKPGKSGKRSTAPDYQELLVEGISQYLDSAVKVHFYIEQHYEGRMPTPRTVGRQIAAWIEKHPVEFELFRNPDKARGRVAPAMGKRDNTTHPNQLWEIDSSPSDAFIKLAEKLLRVAFVCCVDVFSRRRIFWVVETSKSEAILALLRRCIKEWGLPEEIRMDNGADYASKAVKRFCRNLQVVQHFCTPGKPEEKPHVERAFGVLQDSKEFHAVSLAAANVSQWQDLRSREGFKADCFAFAMTMEQTQEWLDAWCLQKHNEVVSTIKCTPNQRIAQATAAGWKMRTLADERQLDQLMLAAPKATGGREGYRNVGKKGIQLLGDTYVGDFYEYAAQDVFVIYAPDDLGRVQVYADETLEKFVCWAYRSDGLTSAELAGIQAQSAAKYRQLESAVKTVARKARGKRKNLAQNPMGLFKDGGDVMPMVQKELVDLPIELPHYGELSAVPNTRPRIDPEEVARVQAEFIAQQQEPEEETVLQPGESPHQARPRILPLGCWGKPNSATPNTK